MAGEEGVAEEPGADAGEAGGEQAEADPAVRAQAQLADTLTTMAGRLVPGACVTVPLLGRKLDAAGIAADPELAPVVRAAVAELVRAVRESRP